MRENKRAIAVMSNDQHLYTDNEDLILDLFKQKIDLCYEVGVKYMFGLGDLFEDRRYQRLSTLLAFSELVRMLHNSGITYIGIPGNHSKTRYDSLDSFDEIFNWATPNFIIHRDLTRMEIDGLGITMLPFFTDEMLVEYIEADEPNDVLLSHFEMNGSTNKGIVSSGKAITKSMLSKYGKVYLGHYHDEHDISDNIKHLKSLYQRGFGEDEKKGFTILYNDGSVEHRQSKFPKYTEIEVNADEVGKAEMKKLVADAKKDYEYVRIKLVGSESKVKSIKKDDLESVGAVVRKAPTPTLNVKESVLTESDVKLGLDESFKLWCEHNEKDYDYGKSLIEKCKNKHE